jgi:hypothetical protein
MPLSPAQQIANIAYFTQQFSLLNEGGFFMWKDTGCIYTKKNGNMVCKRADYKQIKAITNKNWCESTFTLIR